MTARASPDLDELLKHSAWVHRVAVSLVRDGADADDVAQTTWVAALRSPPPSTARAKSWLSTVARNVVRKRARTDARRVQRELDAPDYRDSSLSPESLVERAELQQLIAKLVLEIDEPYRSTLLLRYFEELEPQEIASRSGVPAATVRSRLKRGLDELRDRLDRAHGNKRRAWMLPVAALVGHRASAAPLLLKGIVAMKTKLAIVSVFGLLISSVLVASWTSQRRASRAVESSSASAIPSAAAPSASARIWRDPLRPARSGIEGIVLGPDGRPVVGALVGVVPEDSDADELHVHATATSMSRAGGKFLVPDLRDGTYAVQATAPGLSPAYRHSVVVLDGETVHGIELRLERGGITIVAQLRDAGGGVVPGGRLHARRHGDANRQVFTAACDTAGTCSLTLAKGGYTLVAEAEGYAPAKRDVVAMLDQRVTFQLGPASTVRGRVVLRGSRSPVAGAAVALGSTSNLHADNQAVTGEDGAFEFRDLAPGDYLLSASKGKLAGRSSSTLSVTTGGNVDGAIVEVEPARTVSGRLVVDGSVPSGVVLLRPQGSNSNVIARAQVTSTGTYTIDGVLPGAYQLRAEAAPFAPGMRDVVVGGQDITDADIRLEAGGSISGTVLDRSHRPVAGAVVSATTQQGEFHTTTASTRTKEDGRFELGGLGAGQLLVEASHAEHGATEAAPARLGSGEKKELTLTFDGGSTIEGVVTWDDGTPAVGVTVTSQNTGSAATATTTGANGRYSLTGIDAGVHRVIATREPNVLAARDSLGKQSAVATVAPNDRTTGVDLVLMRGGHSIAGHVLGPDGSPVADALVRADAEDESGSSTASGDPRVGFSHATSGPDGAFVIDDLTAGSFTLAASLPGFASATQAHIAADATDAQLRLKAQSQLEGLAVTSDGKTIADYNLTLFPSDASTIIASNQVSVHDDSGAFTLKGLSAGTFDLLATTPDNRSGRASAVTLGDGEHKSGVRIVMGPGTTLHGRVVEYGTNIPIPGAQVTILSLGTPVSTSTDESGVFSAAGLPAGRVAWIAASVDSRQYLYDRVRVTLPADRDTVDAGDIALVAGDALSRSAGWTGIFPTNLDGIASVETVAPRSPAALAGVRPGDSINSVDGRPMAGLGFHAISYFLGGQPGTKSTVTLGGRSVTFTRVPE